MNIEKILKYINQHPPKAVCICGKNQVEISEKDNITFT
jgi:hypothetical protein